MVFTPLGAVKSGLLLFVPSVQRPPTDEYDMISRVPLYAGESKPIAVLGAGTFKQHLEDNVDDVIEAMKETSTKISELVF